MTLDSILSRVALSVPGCPHPVMAQAIYDAAKMFCERTRVLTQPFTLAVTPGTDEYAISIPATTNIHDFDSVTLDGIQLEALPRGGAYNPDYTYWYEIADPNIRLVAVPEKSGELSGVAVLVSKETGDLPDGLSRWREGIAAGALYRLLGIPGQPWSDGNAAVNQWQMSEAEINKATTASTLPTGKRSLRARSVY